MTTYKQKDVTLIGDILVTHGVLTLGQLHEALCRQYGSDKRLGEIVQSLGMATKMQVEIALLDQRRRRQNREARG